MLFRVLQDTILCQAWYFGLLVTPLCLVFFYTLVHYLLRLKASQEIPDGTCVPPMLPYSIPFIGHTISFLTNSEKLISHGRVFFGNTRMMFSITLFGHPVHIITHPRDVAIVHSKPDTFEFTVVLKAALTALGASKEAVKLLWSPRMQAGVLSQGVIPLSHGHQVRQTSGNDLKILAQHVCRFLIEQTSPEAIALTQGTQGEPKGLHIMDWARETVIYAMQDVYFGKKLHEIDPFLPRAMMEFSELAWQAWYQVPWFLRRKQIKLCKRILSTYQRYLEIPLEERKPTAWFTETFEKDYQEVLQDTTDQAALMMFFHWGIGMNPADATGWLVAHATYDASLAAIIRKETTLAFRDDGSLDTHYLTNSCPVLASTWHEVLRVYTSVTTMRNVTENTRIGDTFLEKGSRLMFSARQLALDETVFGETASEFDPMRFVNDPRLRHSESLRPFGGGKTICPGRHLAMHVATAVVALLLRRFDISPVSPQPFPRADEGEASIGILRTRDELYMRFEERGFH